MSLYTLGEDDVARAKEFARKAHRQQMWGKLPYIEHLEATHGVYTTVARDAEGRAACYLHDVVEDTCKTLAQIEDEFGSVVRRLVDFCTSIPGKNRKEKVQRTNARTAESVDFHAMLVKLSDRIVNVQRSIVVSFEEGRDDSFYKMYRSEQPAFKAAIYRDVPPNTLLQARLDGLF